MPVRLHHIVIDAHDLPRLARFWTQALGWKILSERDREIVIGTDESAPVGMCFMPVTDPKTVKNCVTLVSPRQELHSSLWVIHSFVATILCMILVNPLLDWLLQSFRKLKNNPMYTQINVSYIRFGKSNVNLTLFMSEICNHIEASKLSFIVVVG